MALPSFAGRNNCVPNCIFDEFIIVLLFREFLCCNSNVANGWGLFKNGFLDHVLFNGCTCDDLSSFYLRLYSIAFYFLIVVLRTLV